MVQVYEGGEGVVAGTRGKYPGSLSAELSVSLLLSLGPQAMELYHRIHSMSSFLI